ncbi:MAG TPA: c-type cytochrome [Candidatus Omnitrophota bacterium]|nr:c-type cytochrome [Candidatus Omnitrophota bacterium]
MKTLLAAALAVSFAGPAFAQAMQPFYGGQVAVAGDAHVEMILRDGALKAWVRDHADKPLAAAGKATILAGGKKLEAPFRADGPALVAEVSVKSGDKVTAVLSLTVAGKPVSARFAQEAVAVPPLSGPAAAGAKVFAEACAACHGTALRGTDAGPPLLHSNYAPGGLHGDDIIVAAVNNGAQAHHWKFGDMPKPDGIKPGQDKELLAYIRAMQAANGISAPPAPADGGHASHH